MKITRRLWYLFIAATLFVISSCDSGEVDNDTTAPVVTIEGLADKAKVKGTITVTAKAEDNAEVVMNLFVDDQLIKAETTKALTAEINTKDFSEGLHTIKVVGTDQKQNAGEKSQQIEVRNNLFVLHVSSNYLSDEMKMYYQVSRNDGTSIAFEEITNNGTITIPTPDDFNLDSTFVATEYYRYESTEYGLVIVYADYYTGIIPGEYKLPQYRIPESFVGTHQVQVTDVPTGVRTIGFSGMNIAGISIHSIESNSTVNQDVSLYENSSDLMFSFQKESEIPVYKYIDHVSVGGSSAFSINGLTQMESGMIALTELSTNCWVVISGFTNDPLSRVDVYNGPIAINDDGKVPLYYPGTTFPKYRFRLSHSVGDETDYYVSYGSVPPTTFQYTDGAIESRTHEGKSFGVRTTGSFDILSFEGGYQEQVEGVDKYYNYSLNFGPGAKHHVVLPAVPDALAENEFVSPDDFDFYSLVFYDTPDVSGTEGYHQLVFPGDGIHRIDREYKSTYLNIQDDDGRKGARKKLPDFLYEGSMRSHRLP